MKDNQIKKYLFLFTNAFPCSDTLETYIENEIPFLSEKFEKIYIIPIDFDKILRPVPSNIEVINIHRQVTISAWRFILNLPFIAKIFFSEFFHSQFKLNFIKRMPEYILLLNNAIEVANGLKKILIEKEIKTREVIFYSYWLYHFSLSLAILKDKGFIDCFVSRGHMSDVYDYNNTNNKLVFQQYKVQNATQLHLISKNALDYMNAKYQKHKSKFLLSYLGVKDRGVNQLKSMEKDFVIVSCAKIAPHKRIFMIPEILKHLTFAVKWVHFGSKADDDVGVVENALKVLPGNIKVELKGFVENDKMLEYYQNNPVNLFINVSIKEGISVGMMEALSFGIPLIGTGVFGTPEIVTKETGFLIPVDFNPEAVAAIISKFRNSEQENMRKAARAHYEKYFNDMRNYHSFIEQLTTC